MASASKSIGGGGGGEVGGLKKGTWMGLKKGTWMGLREGRWAGWIVKQLGGRVRGPPAACCTHEWSL